MEMGRDVVKCKTKENKAIEDEFWAIRTPTPPPSPSPFMIKETCHVLLQ